LPILQEKASAIFVTGLSTALSLDLCGVGRRRDIWAGRREKYRRDMLLEGDRDVAAVIDENLVGG
jgi:hypothetical protein